MMLKQNLKRLSTYAIAASLLTVSACKEDEPEPLSLQDTADLIEEGVSEAYFQDLDDMAGVAMAAPTEGEYNGQGRTAATITIEDHRFSCDGIVVTVEPDPTSTTEHPKGVLTVDFGTIGCTDQKGNVRTGKLIFTYDGKRFMPGATVVLTTDDYHINGIKLEGTRTHTNLNTSTTEAPRFNVVLSGGKATFPDGLFATRETNITVQWNRAANPLDDNLQVESSSVASGTTRGGRTYSLVLLEDLIYKRHCGLAVSGVKQYTINSEKEITIDYGDGECDRTFTITVNGTTRTINL